MRIVILTGAGISAESGMGTFRDKGGLWENPDLMKLATPEGFAADPAAVHAWYNMRRAKVRSCQPNAAHVALAALQQDPRAEVTLVTQNVDDLHERAGSHDVIHMHGTHLRALCVDCGARWPAPSQMTVDTRCACGGAARPDVVWFGEVPYHMDRVGAALTQADLFVAIGTSGVVYPAAGFVRVARQAGADTLEINLAPSERATEFARSAFGPATQTVPAWVAEVLA
ncbi:NAD-dependent deacylase [Pseudooctadecabacter jejudonensis]|uniref:NAD-dependent protein deacylase n=1 Tax=Pseudooctadecabacter jejudonensis TaxID=1391910 RepID=A0A1Y5SKJ6_9RHOB|nr:NAD-dependent deacylase [Pseudooctadecabacter jejudonensis]SLN42923.1 NAD-dependent protein deacylase [Pseudooctadecabacter jejudonensis]